MLGARLQVLAHHRQATSLPAYEPVPVYRVTIVDGDVFVDPYETIAV